MAAEANNPIDPGEAEQRAWRVLVLSFASFCILAAALAYLAYWFVFVSTLRLPVELVAARGTIQVTDDRQSVSTTTRDASLTLGDGSSIETDASSQAFLPIRTPHTGDQIGALTVFRNSGIQLIRASTPRFPRSQSTMDVYLTAPAGRIGVELYPGDQPTHIHIESEGQQLRLDAPGRYLVNATAGGLEVAVYEGRAEWDHSTQPGVATIEAGEAAALDESGETILRQPLPENLATALTSGPEQVAWSFYNETQPDGVARAEQLILGQVLVLDRSQERWPGITLGHGETGMFQQLNTVIGDRRTLRLQISFRILEQSLSTCGELGSECPLMVRLDYFDVLGQRATYITGFYSAHNPALGYPLACSTCIAEHEQVRLATWYTFDSGNLLARLPANQLPSELISIQFYASGHAYQVQVRDLQLLLN